MSQAEAKLDLSRIVFIGRTFEEYVKMFDLPAEQMAGKRILDCPVRGMLLHGRRQPAWGGCDGSRYRLLLCGGRAGTQRTAGY
nr:hypothetical protein [Paenibacillus dendritiformis]